MWLPLVVNLFLLYWFSEQAILPAIIAQFEWFFSQYLIIMRLIMNKETATAVALLGLFVLIGSVCYFTDDIFPLFALFFIPIVARNVPGVRVKAPE